MSSTDNTKTTEGYCQYRVAGRNYFPTRSTIGKLPAGFYKPQYDSYEGTYYFEEKKIITPKLYTLPNEARKNIIEDIEKFWKSEERYRNFKSVYKRNILLYSIPGNGKTSLINLLCKELIETYDGVIICIDTQKELDNYTKMMSKFREIEPDRKVITIIEDFERLAKDEYFSALLLQILDGNEQLDSVVTIATTNYPEKLEKRFTCRPSRFNLVMEYKKPNREVREYYIVNKLKDGGVDIEDEKVKADIQRYIDISEGYTFDFLKELIQGIYVDCTEESIVIDRIQKAIKHDGLYKLTEDDGRKAGFINTDEDDTVVDEGVELDAADESVVPGRIRQTRRSGDTIIRKIREDTKIGFV